MRCALLTCEVPVRLVTPNRSNKLVEDSAGRLRPTAAARMNGNSLLSKLDKRYGQEAGCSGAPARRRPGGRHGRRSLGRSTALTHEASLARGRVTHGAAPCTLMQCSNDASQCRCTRAVAHRGARCNPVHHHRDAPRCRCTQVVVHRGARCTTVHGGARDHQIVSQNPSSTGLDFRV